MEVKLCIQYSSTIASMYFKLFLKKLDILEVAVTYNLHNVFKAVGKFAP